MQVPGCSTKGEPCPKTTAQEAKRLIDMCTYVMQLACGVRHGTTEYTCLEKQMNKNGMKPLHVAADYGNVEVCRRQAIITLCVVCVCVSVCQSVKKNMIHCNNHMSVRPSIRPSVCLYLCTFTILWLW